MTGRDYESDQGPARGPLRAPPTRRRPQRILMLSWEFPPRIVGGIARHVDELSRALVRTGLDVDVVTAHHPQAPAMEEIAVSGPPALSEGRRGPAITPGRLRVFRAGLPPIHPLDFVAEIHQLNFALLERVMVDGRGDYDLVHAHDWLVAFAARTLKHGLGQRMVATVHATEAGRNHGIHTPMQHYIHTVEWLLTYDARRVLCCSDAMASEVGTTLRVPADKLRVVPNGVDPDRVACADSPGELREFRRRWVGDGERIVLFVGRLVREKGVEVLVDSMPEVLAAHPDAKFVVAGGGPHEHLWAKAAGRGLGHKIVFGGFVSERDLPRLYAVADVAVYPSLYEPFGIVALEAMAAGVPVVTSDIGGFREVVRHRVTGIHTWANNAHSLAWGLNLVLSDGKLAARLRQAGRREVRRKYGWAGIAQQVLSVYSDVLSARNDAFEQREVGVPGPGVRPRYLPTVEVSARS